MYRKGEGETLVFYPLPPPSDADVRAVATQVARRVLARIAALHDAFAEDPDEYAALSRTLTGAISPHSTARPPDSDAGWEHPDRANQRCALVEWYYLTSMCLRNRARSRGAEGGR